MAHLIVPRRFNGPPSSGNGGWTAGALAATFPHADDATTISVRLKLPPPLDTPMPVEDIAGSAGPRHVISFQGRTVAEAVLSEKDPRPAPPVDPIAAAAAESRYAGLHRHPFPGCFACGVDRRPGDGLRLFAGPTTSRNGEQVVAATWTPYESDVPITWAAMDCPGGWSSDIIERPMVLGTMTARIERLPSTRERYVVVGEQRGTDGRKTFTAATLYGPGDEVLATAEHVWITIDPATFN